VPNFKPLSYASAAALLSFSLSNAAHADAFPRGEGRTFLSTSIQTEVDGGSSSFASLFYEYGLTEDLTFGIDGGSNVASQQTTGIAFLRKTVSYGTHLFSYGLGVGVEDSDDGQHGAIRPIAAWGRGYSASWGNGWYGIEGRHSFFTNGDELTGIDTTFGINNPGGSLSILQLQYSKRSDEQSFIAFAPSFVFKLTPVFSVELGANYQFRTDTTALKVGLWTQF